MWSPPCSLATTTRTACACSPIRTEWVVGMAPPLPAAGPSAREAARVGGGRRGGGHGGRRGRGAPRDVPHSRTNAAQPASSAVAAPLPLLATNRRADRLCGLHDRFGGRQRTHARWRRWRQRRSRRQRRRQRPMASRRVGKRRQRRRQRPMWRRVASALHSPPLNLSAPTPTERQRALRRLLDADHRPTATDELSPPIPFSTGSLPPDAPARRMSIPDAKRCRRFGKCKLAHLCAALHVDLRRLRGVHWAAAAAPVILFCASLVS